MEEALEQLKAVLERNSEVIGNQDSNNGNWYRSGRALGEINRNQDGSMETDDQQAETNGPTRTCVNSTLSIHTAGMTWNSTTIESQST